MKGADFGGALIGHGHRAHLSLLGGAAGRLLLLLCQLPVVVRSRTHTDKKQQGVSDTSEPSTGSGHTGHVMMSTDEQKWCTNDAVWTEAHARARARAPGTAGLSWKDPE